MLSLLSLVAPLPLACQLAPDSPRTTGRQGPRIVGGPTLIAADLEDQWGGHAFSYLLQGERALFWSGLLFEAGTRAAVVGCVPLGDDERMPSRTVLPIDVPDVTRVFQPLLLRTPDGFVHALVGYTQGSPEQGRVATFRSERPEDTNAMLFRGDVPLGSFAGFHCRQNVALDPGGERMVLVTESSFAPRLHPINTPLVVYGRREGLDFAFAPPVAYREPLPVFYPLVAALEDDVVVVGQDHDEDDSRRNAWILHLDWSGHLLHEVALPHHDVAGRFAVHALQRARLGDGRTTRPRAR